MRSNFYLSKIVKVQVTRSYLSVLRIEHPIQFNLNKKRWKRKTFIPILSSSLRPTKKPPAN